MTKRKNIHQLSKCPIDSGRRATDINGELPWDKIPETREQRTCTFSCPFYDDPPSCKLTQETIVIDTECKVSEIKYQQALASKERGR